MMRRSLYRWLASSALVVAVVAQAAVRPHYGGSLRIEMRARVESLDPGAVSRYVLTAGAQEKLGSLVYETLVRLDDRGHPQPRLASTWQHDEDHRRWQFWLQPEAALQDGSRLGLQQVSDALLRANPAWQVSTVGDSLVLQFDAPRPNLLTELARFRNAVAVSRDGRILGTGPFRLAEFESGRRARFVANEHHWGGRPYVDEVSVEMGRSLRQQAIDFELGKADVVEVSFQDIRALRDAGRPVAVSEPAQLMALVFSADRKAVADPRLRQAIALAIDRRSIHSVLLQGEGESGRGLLPQWMSGYAFLFDSEPDVARARSLRQQMGSIPRLTLAYDFADPLAQAIADRVAVNASAAGIDLQVFSEAMESRPANADIQLLRLQLPTTEPAAALEGLAAMAGEDLAVPVDYSTSLEHLYRAERVLLEAHRVIPLVFVPEAYSINPQVHDWLQPAGSGWAVEDVWLEVQAP